jgi:hypothetical protein
MNNKGSATVVLIVIIVLLLGVVSVGAYFLFFRGGDELPEQVSEIGIEADIVTNEEQARNVKPTPSSFTTYYQRDIYVRNGNQATCHIGNSSANPYENIYIQLFLNDGDDNPSDELYLSKLIPKGSHIESFTMERELEPGDYRGTLVHACLDEEGNLVSNYPVIVEIHVS